MLSGIEIVLTHQPALSDQREASTGDLFAASLKCLQETVFRENDTPECQFVKARLIQMEICCVYRHTAKLRKLCV